MGLGSQYKNLDEVKRNMPRVDYLDTMPAVDEITKKRTWTVTSVKSIELRDDTYTKTSGSAIVNTINGARRDLTASKFSDMKLIERMNGRKIDIVKQGDALQRNLLVVIPQDVSATGAQGKKLIEAYCKVRFVNNTMGVGMDIWFGNGQGEPFYKWKGITGSDSEGRMSEGECRRRGHVR